MKEIQSPNMPPKSRVRVVCVPIKKYEQLQAENKRLKEAIIRGRELYENNEPRQMFLVWEQALKGK